MIIDFHGMKCRFSTYTTNGERRKILTLVNPSDWKKSLQYDFTEPQYGLWCHFLTDEEFSGLFPKPNQT